MVVVMSGVEFTCARARLRSDVLSDPRAALLGQRTTFDTQNLLVSKRADLFLTCFVVTSSIFLFSFFRLNFPRLL